MGRAWEWGILAAGVLLAAPLVVLALGIGPAALFGVPIVAIAAFALYARVRQRRLHPTPPAPPAPIVPVAAPEEDDLAGVPEPVTACPRCGYLGVRMPEIRDGLWPGGGELGSRVVCRRCHYQGLPVSFDRREEYRAFLQELGTSP